MKVAFYYANKGSWLDRWIGLLTWGQFSHCEIVFSDGTCFSSSPRDGGTRFKKINFQPDHWEFIELELSYQDEDTVLAFCEGEVGKPYDWAGAIFRLPFMNGRWYCSEVCVEALERGGVPIDGSSFWSTPNSLFEDLENV